MAFFRLLLLLLFFFECFIYFPPTYTSERHYIPDVCFSLVPFIYFDSSLTHFMGFSRRIIDSSYY